MLKPIAKVAAFFLCLGLAVLLGYKLKHSPDRPPSVKESITEQKSRPVPAVAAVSAKMANLLSSDCHVIGRVKNQDGAGYVTVEVTLSLSASAPQIQKTRLRLEHNGAQNFDVVFPHVNSLNDVDYWVRVYPDD